MKQKSFSWSRIAAVMLLVFVQAGITQARELRYATGYPPNTAAVFAAEAYANALKEHSNGELSIKIYAGSLLSFQEASAGVRDGIADVSLLFMSYFPAEYPRSNMMSELTMLLELTEVTPDKAGIAYVGALSEYIMRHCPECADEFKRQNQVFLGGGGSPPYWLLCNKPVRTLSELKGKRLRAGGAQWSRWANALGGTPVSIAANEMYEGLSQGIIDCSMAVTTELTVWSLNEVVTDITLQVPGGVYGASATNFNANTWRGLSEQQRKAVMRASALFSADATWRYTREGLDNLDNARENKKIRIHEPDAELLEATVEFIEQDMRTIAQAYGRQYGIKNPEQMIADFRPLLDKWVERVQDVESSSELADLYWREAFSKVDFSTYGL